MTTCYVHLAYARIVAGLLAAVLGAGSVALAGGSLVEGRDNISNGRGAHAGAGPHATTAAPANEGPTVHHV